MDDHACTGAACYYTVRPPVIGWKEDSVDVSFWLGILIGLVVGGGGVWYFKVRSLQKSVLTMTGEYRAAEKGRKDLEEKSRQR
jgi:hypothetical protein